MVSEPELAAISRSLAATALFLCCVQFRMKIGHLRPQTEVKNGIFPSIQLKIII